MSQTRIYHAKSLPKRNTPSQLVFVYDTGRMGLSTTLYRQMGGEAIVGVAVVEHGKGFYVTRADKTGHWLNRGGKPKFGVCSLAVYSKSMVRHLMRSWGYGEGDAVTVPVTVNAPDDLVLNAEEYPHPLYRLQVDCIKPKVAAR